MQILWCFLSFFLFLILTISTITTNAETSSSSTNNNNLIDTIILLETTLAPIISLGGKAYTIIKPNTSLFVCIAPHYESLHPITFADFDIQFSILYDASEYNNIATPPKQLKPIGILDTLQGCYVNPQDRAIFEKPSCLAFLNSTSEDCFRNDIEALLFNSENTVAGMLALYINHFIPQRAQMRQMITQSLSFTMDIKQLKALLVRNQGSILSSDYDEIIKYTMKDLNTLMWNHRILLQDKWKLLQNWLKITTNNTTNFYCPAVDSIQEWLLNPGNVTVEIISSSVQDTLSKIFISNTTNNNNNNNNDSMRDRAFCAAAFFAISTIFLNDLVFLQVDKLPRIMSSSSSSNRWVIDTLNILITPVDIGYLRNSVRWEWQFMQNISNNEIWNCLNQIFLTDIPTIPSVATCFIKNKTEKIWNFNSPEEDNNNSEVTIIVDNINARRLEYRQSWSYEGFLYFSVVEAKNISLQTGLIDFPLKEEELPPFPQGVTGDVPKKYLSNNEKRCPAGTFAMIEDNYYCMECVNDNNSFIYCPGDEVMHKCSNKAQGSKYIPTGLRPSSNNQCLYYCTDPYTFLINNICDFRAGYYMNITNNNNNNNNNNTLMECKLPSKLVGEILLPFQVFIGSGAPNFPHGCPYIIRRRYISQINAPIPLPFRWCQRDLTGSSLRVTTIISRSAIYKYHKLHYNNNNNKEEITSIAYELISVIPNGWSWYLISYLDAAPASPGFDITMQLAWNASFSSNIFFSINWTLNDGCLACIPREDKIHLNLTFSWNPIAEEILFFVNDKVLGKPIHHPGARGIATSNCNSSFSSSLFPSFINRQISIGGWVAGYESQLNFIGKTITNRLPKYFEYFPGEIKFITLMTQPFSPFGNHKKEEKVTVPSFTIFPNLNFASSLFSTATSMTELARITNKLQQKSLMSNITSNNFCRLGSQRYSINSPCFTCPIGSYALLPSETLINSDAICNCVSTQRMSIDKRICLLRLSGYGTPLGQILVPNFDILLPLQNFISPIPLVRYKVDEYTRPLGVSSNLKANAIASVECTPGFSLFIFDNNFDNTIITVLFNSSLGILNEHCDIHGITHMDPFRDSPPLTQRFTFTLQASTLLINNININPSITLHGDQQQLWLTVVDYILLPPISLMALKGVELNLDKQEILRFSLNQTIINVNIKCGVDWESSHILGFNAGILLPTQEGKSCTLNLTVSSLINAFKTSLPLIITLDSCVDGRSKGLIALNSKISAIIISLFFYIATILTSVYYCRSVVNDYNKKSKLETNVTEDRTQG